MPGYQGAVSRVRRRRTREGGSPWDTIFNEPVPRLIQMLVCDSFFVPNRRPASIPLLSRSFNTKKFTCKLGCSPYPSGSCRKAFSKMSFQWKWAPPKQRNSNFSMLAKQNKKKNAPTEEIRRALIEGKFEIYSNSFVPSSCVTEEKNLQIVKGTYLTTIYAELS